MIFTLGVGDKSASVGVQGEYVWIKNATGPLEIHAVLASGKKSSYPLEKDDQIRFSEGLAFLQVENSHNATQQIEVLVGFGQFIPNRDGQKVVLTAQDVDISTSNADIGDTNDAAAGSDTGNFSLIALLKRLLTKLPSTVGQKVKANSLSVSLASDHDTIAVAQVVGSTLVAGAVIAGTGTIPANPDRKRIGIKALKANTGIGWTHNAANGGDALEAGDRVIFETTAAVDITATVGTDKFAWWEEE